MTAAEALEFTLPLFQRYYDIERESPAEPFQAEAAFHARDEQYFLVKRAKYTESESHEYAFFAARGELSLAEAQALDEAAWEEGMSRVKPSSIHRNTDVTLVILADTVAPDAAAFIEKLRRSKSYMFMLQGYSNYHVIAIETSTGRMACNRQGRHLRKLFGNIKFSE